MLWTKCIIDAHLHAILLYAIVPRTVKEDIMTNSGITILPYIDQSAYTKSSGTSSSSAKESSGTSEVSFDETLNSAQKAAAALAVDSLLSSSDSDAVTTAMLQNYLNDNNIRITLTPTGAATASTNNANANTNINTNATGTTTNTYNAGVPADNASDSTNTSADSTSASAADSTVPASNTNYSNDGSLKCSAELEAYFEEASKTYGVDIKLLKAIAKQESNFNANATSKSGAMGIMQLMPFTAKELGIDDAYDAKSNIMGGAKLIAKLLDKYDGNKTLALAAYNAGSSNVDKYGGVPPFNETQNYVRKVLSYYNS